MNEVLRQQILAMARQAGGEFYEGFAGSPNTIKFTAAEFERFITELWQEAHDQGYYYGHDAGYDEGYFAADTGSY
jgi:hypothetical protein